MNNNHSSTAVADAPNAVMVGRRINCGEVDFGGFLGENVFSSLTGDYTPQHNDPDYTLGTLSDEAIVSGLHTATMLPSILRRAGVACELDGSERFINLRLNRLRWVKPIPVGTKPEWSFKVTEAEYGPTRVITTQHVVGPADAPNMLAEHVGAVVPLKRLPVSPADFGDDRVPVIRDRGPGLRADVDRLYQPAYLNHLLALPTPRYLGATPWLSATQFDADAFAEVSGGRVPWSNDPEFCGKHLQSAPVVHAMYPLALASWAANHVGIIPADGSQEPFGTGVAYGFDSVRWYEDLPIGSRLRVHVTLEDVQSKGPDRYLFSVAQDIELENDPFVAVSFNWKFLIFTAEP